MDATAGGSPPPSALRLLSLGKHLSTLEMALLTLILDGGGIRGISALVILDEIMHRVQRAEGLSSVPLPADYFDLICGTSTGG
jgi:patatin-like phospholipase/acyl hydrolase